MVKLYSASEVRDMWPDPKPRERDIKRLAKEHGCCRKIGRAIGFTPEDVEQLLAVCSTARDPKYAVRPVIVRASEEKAYREAMARLNAGRKVR